MLVKCTCHMTGVHHFISLRSGQLVVLPFMCLSINNVILAFILPLYKNVLFFSGGKWLQKLYSLNVMRILGATEKTPHPVFEVEFLWLVPQVVPILMSSPGQGV